MRGNMNESGIFLLKEKRASEAGLVEHYQMRLDESKKIVWEYDKIIETLESNG